MLRDYQPFCHYLQNDNPGQLCTTLDAKVVAVVMPGINVSDQISQKSEMDDVMYGQVDGIASVEFK